MSNNRNRQKARLPTNEGTVAQSQIVRVFNTGYDESGASTRKGSMKGWNPLASSPQSDLDANLPTLIARSRSAVMNSPIGTSAIDTSTTYVIGAGLRLRSRIDYEILGISAEEAKMWQKRTQKEFDVWAGSKFCDLIKRNNFYDMQDIVYSGYLMNGDSWAALKYRKPIPGMPYRLRLQLFEADRVRNPDMQGVAGQSPLSIWTKNRDNGNRIVNGVEIDSDGAVVAYWICNQYSYDPTTIDGIPQWKRVEAFGANTGMPNVLQICHDRRAETYRGAPYLSPVLESLKQVTRFTEAELTSAIVKAFLTLFFKQQAGMSPQTMFPMSENVNANEKVSLNADEFELGAGSMNVLPPGYDVTSVDGSRTQSTFDVFTTAIIKQIAAAIGQPYEVLMKSFSASYSASRAALLQAWAAYKMRRTWFTRDFCQPVYEQWLMEAVALGRIEAPGFFTDPLIRAAWCGAEWYGPVMGSLDPVKEAKGAALRMQYGLSTGEKEAAEMTGTDFDANIQQRSLELGTMAQLGVAFSPATTVNIIEEGGKNKDA